MVPRCSTTAPCVRSSTPSPVASPRSSTTDPGGNGPPRTVSRRSPIRSSRPRTTSRFNHAYNTATFAHNDFAKPGLAAYPARSQRFRATGCRVTSASLDEGTGYLVHLDDPGAGRAQPGLAEWPAGVTVLYRLPARGALGRHRAVGDREAGEPAPRGSVDVLRCRRPGPVRLGLRQGGAGRGPP